MLKLSYANSTLGESRGESAPEYGSMCSRLKGTLLPFITVQRLPDLIRMALIYFAK
jgi:hypothetical protein